MYQATQTTSLTSLPLLFCICLYTENLMSKQEKGLVAFLVHTPVSIHLYNGFSVLILSLKS